ncbi:MAG: hypothetical protein OXI37_08500 [Gammaproteobacteria bacterium]|nr:hypothetical protein [Gammaproteobacteria bacterium]
MSRPGDDWPSKPTKEDLKGLKWLLTLMLGPFALLAIWTAYQEGKMLEYLVTGLIGLVLLALGVLALYWFTLLLEKRY